MAKVQIYELVKELGSTPKDLISKLKELGVEAKSPLTPIDTEDVDRLKKYIETGEVIKRETPVAAVSKPTYEPIVQRPSVVVRFESDKSKPAEKPKKAPAKKTAAKKTDEAATDKPKAPAKKTTKKTAETKAAVSDTKNVAMPEEKPIAPKAEAKPAAQKKEPITKPEEKQPEISINKPPEPQKTEAPPIKQPEINTAAQIPAKDNKPEKTTEVVKDIPAAAEIETQQKPAVTQADKQPAAAQADRQQKPRREGESSQRQTDRPQGDRPPRREGERPQGDRPYRQGERPQGDRPYRQGERPQGERPYRQGERPQGDRPYRQGERPQGDRPYRQGERPQGMGQQRQGERPPFQGQRPQGPRRDKISDMMPRTDKPADQKSGAGKPMEARPRKKDSDKRRPQENDAPKRKKNAPGMPITDDGDSAVRRRKPGNQNRKKEPQMTATAAKKLRKRLQAQEEAASTEIKVLQIPKSIVITEFAAMMRISPADIVKELFLKKNMPVSQNTDISFELASEIALERGYLTEETLEVDLLEKFFADDDESESEELKRTRPPVVVVMGHVDHGKTSLLDAIRDTNVMSGEAGGITQHIGAYTVVINERVITFLDTPGHEAFTAMRMRGAQVTDIAVLVVAADDGVMPQTVEAINHAKAANVEIIVAINKIDKPGANPDRVKQELTEHGILVEDWGGETICVPVSAKNREGIPALLEMILLAADIKDFKANPDKSARGTIIEAALDKGRGPVATILVKDGTINIGDPIVAGGVYGKIRAMTDDKGNKVKSAGPSMPVEILGLSGAPQAGDSFFVAKTEREARQLSESVVAKGRQEMLRDTVQKVSLDALFDQIQQGTVKELNIVVKADVQGSVEAVKTSLEKLSNDEVRIRTIHGGVGAVTESDVMLASASNAIIIGFNVRPDAQAVTIAETEKVDMRLYRIIYNAIEDITAAMKGLLDPIFEEKVIGQAEIRQLFKASGVGTIGGAYVTTGKLTRAAKVRIVRGGTVIYEGELDALRRFKDDVKEVLAGYECGLTFNKYNDIKEGDIVEAFVMEEIPR